LILLRHQNRGLAAIAATACCIVAGLVLQTAPAPAVRGAYVDPQVATLGADVIATVWVGTSPWRRCRGSVRLAGWRARLPRLKTDRAGGGRWRWKVADNVPAGTWHVRVQCRLPGETVVGKAKFHAPHGPQTGRSARGLIAPGTMSAEPKHKKGRSVGVIGITAESAFLEQPGPCACAAAPSPAAIQLQAPAEDETVSGDVTVEAAGAVAAVRFEAFYSQTPQLPGTAEWHPLGDDAAPGDGFAISWNSSEAPNQGLSAPETVWIRATGYGGEGVVAGHSTRQVAVANPDGDGYYRYHVFHACAAGGGCEVDLHAGPGYSYSAVGQLTEGDEVDIACQTKGKASLSSPPTKVWDRLSNGAWIADHQVDTPIKGAFSPPIPLCE
jgi:hypothetical protein